MSDYLSDTLVRLHRRHSHSYSHSHSHTDSHLDSHSDSDCRAGKQKSRPKTKFMCALCVPVAPSLSFYPSPSLSLSRSAYPPLKERCRNCVTLFVSNFNKFARHLWPFVQIFNLFLGRFAPLHHLARLFVLTFCGQRGQLT